MTALIDPAPLFERIQVWIDCGYFDGASLQIVKNGRVLCEKYWGSSRPDSVEYIASAGKWLAAATILAVVEEDRLSLDDSAAKWLPELAGAKGGATLRQLLSHTSGYPAYQPEGARRDAYQTLEEAVAHLAPLAPDDAPGTRWNYGGLAMQAAGRMAEVATGEVWETIFQERIARPLKMTNTHFTPVQDEIGHNPMLGGGARSTLQDYANFLSMMSGNGKFEGRQILSRKSIEAMQADQVGSATLPPDNFVSTVRGHLHHGIYGLGLWREMEDAAGRAVLISSPGWAGTYPWIDRRNDLYGIFLAHIAKSAADGFNSMLAAAELPILAGNWLLSTSNEIGIQR